MVAFTRYVDRRQKEFMNRSLLIIEDDLDELDFLARRFFRSGYHVFSANHPHQALEVARVRQFHVAIIDLSLRDRDRIEFVRSLKRYQDFVQLIVLSRYHKDREFQAKKEGAFAFLSKPCTWANLELAVEDAWDRAWSERRRSERPAKGKRTTLSR